MSFADSKVRVPEAVCPSCKQAVNGASNTAGVKLMPKEGDLTICLYCAGVAQYDATLQLKIFDVLTLPAAEQEEIEKYRRLVRLAHAKVR